MRQHVGDLFPVEVRHQIVKVGTQLLNIPVLILADAERQRMQLDIFAGEISSDFLADEKIGVMNQPQGALDGVVIRQGNIRHPCVLADLVGCFGFRIAFPDTGLSEKPQVRFLGEP